MEGSDIKARIASHLQKTYENAPVLRSLAAGEVDKAALKLLALNHYSETKAFLDVTLPARLYLCPHEAMSAKRYFWHLYGEEQGNFHFEQNHAEMFKPVCHELGIPDEELDGYYQRYLPLVKALLLRTPSIETMVEQLAVSLSWEGLTPHFGKQLLTTLPRVHAFSEKAMYYFKEHLSADEEHSAAALSTLVEYCTDERYIQIAMTAITTTLVTGNYLTRRL